MGQKVKNITVVLLCGLWMSGLFLWGIFRPDEEISLSERRKFAQMPEVSRESLADGSFMGGFEKYAADQFPCREGFRKLKSVGEYFVFRRGDSNGVYLYKGYAGRIDYPFHAASADYAAERMALIYDKFLKDCAGPVYFSIVPDKNYYMRPGGVPTLDYEALVSRMREQTPFAEYIDLFPALQLEDYYRTDTHWRIEKIGPAAGLLAGSMGVKLSLSYDVNEVDTDFYGVFCGQSALPLKADKMYTIWHPMFDGVTVYNLESQGYIDMYCMENKDSADPYDIYLGGPRSMIVIQNPNASTERELVLIRDSFGSSLAPYFIEAYKTVTLLDIRYLPASMLNRYCDFSDKTVLFLYSAMLLNNSETLR